MSHLICQQASIGLSVNQIMNPLYIHTKSNHPPTILKHLKNAICSRLCCTSSDSQAFNKAKPIYEVQVNLDMTDPMGPRKLVRHMQNPSYTYDEYLICIGLGPSISSVICKNLSYSGPSYPSSPVALKYSGHQ